MKINGAQIVIECLYAHGATTVFGYPGGAVLPIYDALYKNADRINHIISAHEQGAAHAADGYARVSGKTGVVIATSGPGATNLVTGIANAYLDSVPLVAITGNVAVPLLGKDSFQEVDIVGITQPIVKHNFVVRDINALANTINQAFRIANSGRRGPVLVDIPRNIQEELTEYTPCAEVQSIAQNTHIPAERNITAAAQAIKNCKKPYIYAGGGVLASGAEQKLLELSKKICAPVGFSMMGLTALPYDYELNLGMCGMHGRYAATAAHYECDTLIALGVRFSDRATGNVEAYKQGRTIIHADIDVSEFGKNVPPQINICGDIDSVLTMLLRELPAMNNPEWLNRINELKESEKTPETDNFTPKNILTAVSRFFDKDTIIATDVGQHQMWTMQHYPFFKPRTLLTSGGLGTMGYGLGAAIGGCMANNGKRTVLFTGDGSFGMNLNELATAVSQNLPVVIIIFNNGALGMVRQWQNMFFGERYSQTTLNRKTDFVALAKAFGAQGCKAESLSELTEAIGRLPDNTPAVIDCHINIDAKVLPMIPPGGTIKNIIRSVGNE